MPTEAWNIQTYICRSAISSYKKKTSLDRIKTTNAQRVILNIGLQRWIIIHPAFAEHTVFLDNQLAEMGKF